MTDYRPTNADLLRTVRDFLADIGPTLPAAERYTALVCTHILAMTERELTMDALPALDEGKLAAEIRAGLHDTNRDLLATLLHRATIRVATVRPEHLDGTPK